MHRLNLIIRSFALVLLIISRAQAQVLSTAYAEVPELTFKTEARFVLLDVSVINKRTNSPVSKLELGDLIVREDGIPQRLTYITKDVLPLSVVLMIDGTYTVRPVLEHLAAGARAVLEHLKPEDEVSVSTFSSHARLLQDFTTDREVAEAAIIQASNIPDDRDGTFIHEDVFAATEQAMRSTIPHTRRVEIWLTDGTANNTGPISRRLYGKFAPEHIHSKREAHELLGHSDVAVSAIIERSSRSDVFSAIDFEFGTSEIEHYAQETGGSVISAGHGDVASRLGQLIDILRERYTVGYTPLTQKAAGSLSKLHCDLSSEFFARHPEISKNDVQVRTRTSYYR